MTKARWALNAAKEVAAIELLHRQGKNDGACPCHSRFTSIVELPDDLARFKLPTGVSERLTSLLDKQDSGQALTDPEQREAEGLVDLADTLTYLGLKARAAA